MRLSSAAKKADWLKEGNARRELETVLRNVGGFCHEKGVDVARDTDCAFVYFEGSQVGGSGSSGFRLLVSWCLLGGRACLAGRFPSVRASGGVLFARLGCSRAVAGYRTWHC